MFSNNILLQPTPQEVLRRECTTTSLPIGHLIYGLFIHLTATPGSFLLGRTKAIIDHCANVNRQHVINACKSFISRIENVIANRGRHVE